MTKNIIAIDIGNTGTSIGLFRGKRLKKTFALKSVKIKKTGWAGNIKKEIDNILCFGRNRKVGVKRSKIKVDAVIIASVVPALNSYVSKSFAPVSKTKPVIIGKDIFPPVRNFYKYPEQVGQDRLVNAAAGFFLYGGPLIIVDLGTAITVDLISKKGAYLGGIISPGIDISLQTLHKRTALLPLVELSPPRELLGRDTVSSIKSGIVIGYSALVDGLVTRLKKQYEKKAKVIATGGYLKLMRRYCKSIDIVNNSLTLEGIRIIWEESINAKKVNLC